MSPALILRPVAGKTLLGLLLGLLLLPPSAAASYRPLGGDLPLAAFPENAEQRVQDFPGFLSSLPSELRSSPPLLRKNGWGSWKREVIVSGSSQYLIYAAERNGSYPLYSQGSWIIKRRLQGGQYLQAKIYLKSDPGTFLRVYPDGERCRLDLVIKGGVFVSDLPLPLSFSRLLQSRVADLVELTRAGLDWSLLEPRPEEGGEVAALAAAIRARLQGLRYAEDGGLDAQGRLVFIANGAAQPPAQAGLNCSGFSQWVVDGIVKPLSGLWLDRSELSLKHIDSRKSSAEPSFEDSLDPYFGLDWTRNLALAADSVLQGGDQTDIHAEDVREAPFALIEASSAPINGGPEYLDFAPYEEDAGFASEGIPALLWWLAIKDPGYFYLASISQQDRAGLRHHYHISVLLPWFDREGVFHVDVFESAAETSLQAVIDRTRGQMIHLVRLPATRSFDAPLLAATRLP